MLLLFLADFVHAVQCTVLKVRADYISHRNKHFNVMFAGGFSKLWKAVVNNNCDRTERITGSYIVRGDSMLMPP